MDLIKLRIGNKTIAEFGDDGHGIIALAFSWQIFGWSGIIGGLGDGSFGMRVELSRINKWGEISVLEISNKHIRIESEKA